MPGIGVGDIAADNRTEDGRDDDGDGGQRKSLLSFLWREMIEDDGLLRRLQPAAEEALHGAEQQDLQKGSIRPQPSERSGKHRDADQKYTCGPGGG